jgi:hypothetical protein
VATVDYRDAVAVAATAALAQAGQRRPFLVQIIFADRSMTAALVPEEQLPAPERRGGLANVKDAILRVLGESTEPLKARTLASRTGRYKYNSYFLSAVKELCEDGVIFARGQKYAIAPPNGHTRQLPAG